MNQKTKKLIVYTFRYKAIPEQPCIEEILDKMRETGEAEIIDVLIEERP